MITKLITNKIKFNCDMPGPDVRANDNVLGEMSTEPTATVHNAVEAKAERKLTVLETHGYVLGRTIGSGSYATVKVKEI